MNCTGCKTCCCENNRLMLTEDELEEFLGVFPNLKYIKSGPFVILDETCPFYIEKQCRNYPNRPEICRLYPFDYQGHVRGKCKAALSISPQDRARAFTLIKHAMPRLYDNATKHRQEFMQFNLLLQKMVIWQTEKGASA